MKIEFSPEWSEEFMACFADVDLVRKDGKVVFSTNQQTDGISIKTVVREFFAEIDAEEFQSEVKSYFGRDAEFSGEEFDIMVNGVVIGDDLRDAFLIHIVDECGFRLTDHGPVREFQKG